jgi:hypothetical protein
MVYLAGCLINGHISQRIHSFIISVQFHFKKNPDVNAVFASTLTSANCRPLLETKCAWYIRDHKNLNPFKWGGGGGSFSFTSRLSNATKTTR